MCLLKPNERSNSCAHEECKQLSAANKQGCLFSLAQVIKPNMVSNTSNFSRPSQNLSGAQNSQFSGNQATQGSNYTKVVHSAPQNDESDDEEQFTLNKKKIKLDSTNTSSRDNKHSGFARDNQGKSLLLNSGYQQSASNSNYGEQSVFNMMLPNNQNIMEQKPNNFQVVNMNHMNQPFYLPYMQNPQDNNNIINQNGYFVNYPQNIQPSNFQVANLQPSFQNLAQNQQKIVPNMNYDISNYVSPSNENNTKENNNAQIEEFMKGVQSKLVDMLSNQNKMLIDLREKNELVQDTLACLINEVNALKQIVKQSPKEKALGVSQNLMMTQQIVDNSREISNSEGLLKILYGPKQDFDYQIVLKNELPSPLYRERNFKFTVFLTDKEGNLVKNTNRIPLTLAIYTSENPPKYVDVNTSGNKILKGMTDKDLIDGTVTFDKIQIKEVTSHFRNGWVFFVVYPKTSGMVLNNLTAGVNGVMVNPQQVKPLILEKVVVKAKRSIKEKDSCVEIEDLKDFGVETHIDNEIFEC